MANLFLLSIIFHRIGIIILVISTGVMIALPHIFHQEDDFSFGNKTSQVLTMISKVGLIFLVITGLLRLSFGIPLLFAIKAPAVLIVLYLYFRYEIKFDPEMFDRYQYLNLLRLFTVIITAGIGLLL